eukprot:421033_1
MSTTTLPPGSSDPQIQSGSGYGSYNNNNNGTNNSSNSTNRRRNNVPNYLQGNINISSRSQSHSHHSHSSSSLWTPASYCSRLVDVSQMDIQSALDQMRSLLTVGVGGIISSIGSGNSNSSGGGGLT